MYYRISEEVFAKLPKLCVGLVAVKGLENHQPAPQIAALLAAAIAEQEAYFEGKKVKEDAGIVPYREAFRALGSNPNKYLCSIEALLTRIAKKKGFPSINPIVDMGNAISIKYRLPIGAHDLATIPDGLEVRLSREGDTFLPFGETTPEAPDAGETVYAAGSEVRTRRWTWRQSEQGKITADTTDVLFPIDGFTDVNEDEIRAAMDQFAALLKEVFGLECERGFVDAAHDTFRFFEA